MRIFMYATPLLVVVGLLRYTLRLAHSQNHSVGPFGSTADQEVMAFISLVELNIVITQRTVSK